MQARGAKDADLYALARCALLYHPSMDVHRSGKGIRDFHRKMSAGASVELHLCARLRAVIIMIKKYGIVALAVLNDVKIEEIVANPEEFALQEVGYKWHNIMKTLNLVAVKVRCMFKDDEEDDGFAEGGKADHGGGIEDNNDDDGKDDSGNGVRVHERYTQRRDYASEFSSIA